MPQLTHSTGLVKPRLPGRLDRSGVTADHTLAEVGQQRSVPCERIRQIEAKELRKLKHPHRCRILRTFS
jgi:DNA-directed RNA polymerase sigma subunit (sigma70/sigma32)